MKNILPSFPDIMRFKFNRFFGKSVYKLQHINNYVQLRFVNIFLS